MRVTQRSVLIFAAAARDWAQVLYAYRLHVAPVDYDSLALLLEHCKTGATP